MLLAKALGKENSLIIHHCSAHRDQLVFQKSMEKHSDFVTLEKEVNAAYKVSYIPSSLLEFLRNYSSLFTVLIQFIFSSTI